MAGALVMMAVTAAVLLGAAIVIGRNRGGDQLPTSSDVNKYGWLVTQWPDQRILDGYQGQPFHPLKRPEVSDAFSGTHRGREFLAANLNFSDTNGTGAAGKTWYAHVAITLPAATPLVEIRPRGLLSGLADAVGLPGRSYGDDPFNRRFHVNTTDDAFAEKIINSGLSTYLSATPDPLPLTLEHGEIRTWIPTTVGDDELVDLLDSLSDAIDAIPAHVWAESGGAGYPPDVR